MLSICLANPQKTRIIGIYLLIERPQIFYSHNSRISSSYPNYLNCTKLCIYVPFLHPLLQNLRDFIPIYLKKSVITVKLQDSTALAVNPVTSFSNVVD